MFANVQGNIVRITERGGEREGENPFTFDKLYVRIFRTRLEQTMARVELWRVGQS